MHTLDEWQHHLLGAHHSFEILTDHKNLEFFCKPQALSHCQACWQQVLQEYDFTLSHHPGKSNPANLLSWCPDFSTGVEYDNSQQVFLPEHLFDTSCLHIVQTTLSISNKSVELPSALPLLHLESIETTIYKNQYKHKQYVKEGL